MNIRGTTHTLLHSDVLATVAGLAAGSAAAAATGWYLTRTARTIADLHVEVTDANQRAFTDPLTGLGNRAAFDAAARDTAQTCRAMFGRPLVCLLIDIEAFKQINDTHGHAAGDRALITTAHVLEDLLNSYGTVARIGGDEFAAILAAPTDQDPNAWATRLAWAGRTALTRLTQAAGGPVVRITVGIAVADPQYVTWQALLARADDAMYRARNRDLAVTHQPTDADEPVVTYRPNIRRRDQRRPGTPLQFRQVTAA
ncbi:GGDEF domain-containing protein [Fodinicola feengrottensis]|uniref:GGDEF domain-containing protein n=1 Tax=Fodinicola feengrottensis TaxID=435914 RepID=A0ABN2ILX4_9ACTN|nr:GGDEF domain-containing protein [Fodinicola feengrottensis]